MSYKNKPSIFEVNLLYLLLGIGLLTLGAIVQSRELYSGLLVTEFILILAPCLLFLKVKGAPIKAVLRLNRIGLRQILLVIGITIFTYPLAVLFQAIFIGILNIFKDLTPSGVPLPNDGIQYIISFFIIAVAPGICEEVMFRGVIMNTYGSIGHKKSIIMTALLFGMFHFNIMNFIGPTVLGVVFGIIVYKTNSLYSAIIGHTVNNSIALTIGFFLNQFQQEIDEIMMDSAVQPENIYFGIGNILMTLIFLALCFIIVKSFINKLEPVVEEIEAEDEFSYESSRDNNFNMGNIDFEKIGYRPRRVDSIRYLPIVMVVFIFLLVNWLYFFL